MKESWYENRIGEKCWLIAWGSLHKIIASTFLWMDFRKATLKQGKIGFIIWIKVKRSCFKQLYYLKLTLQSGGWLIVNGRQAIANTGGSQPFSGIVPPTDFCSARITPEVPLVHFTCRPMVSRVFSHPPLWIGQVPLGVLVPMVWNNWPIHLNSEWEANR
jgi:hypothetical protein